ncbi:hypothetical protein ScPMuIL_003878 [Solemya velum]
MACETSVSSPSRTLNGYDEFLSVKDDEHLCNTDDPGCELHLAALTSLKGEIIELTNRLQHVTKDRDLLEKQLNRAQTDKTDYSESMMNAWSRRHSG